MPETHRQKTLIKYLDYSKNGCYLSTYCIEYQQEIDDLNKLLDESLI